MLFKLFTRPPVIIFVRARIMTTRWAREVIIMETTILVAGVVVMG